MEIGDDQLEAVNFGYADALRVLLHGTILRGTSVPGDTWALDAMRRSKYSIATGR